MYILLKTLKNRPGWDQINDTEKINKAILDWTKEIFEEVNQLPITNDSITGYLGKYAQNNGAEDVLQNKIHKKSLDVASTTYEFLKNLRRPDTIPNDLIQCEMTTEEYVKTFRMANEYTTASPSGINYFHY